MIGRIFRRSNNLRPGMLTSQLFDEKGFYRAFIKDLSGCMDEVIVESPFITTRCISTLLPIFQRTKRRGVRIIINTRHPQEHDGRLRIEAEEGIVMLRDIGVQVLFTGGHHRKIAILDRRILWEGSLNILSQNDSCELMRRIDSIELA